MPPLSHPISCTPTKSHLYLANSLAAAVSGPALYRLLTFQVPNLEMLGPCIGTIATTYEKKGNIYCINKTYKKEVQHFPKHYVINP